VLFFCYLFFLPHLYFTSLKFSGDWFTRIVQGYNSFFLLEKNIRYFKKEKLKKITTIISRSQNGRQPGLAWPGKNSYGLAF
jgi:hypothetical protein